MRFAQALRHFERFDQRQPFGIGIAALAQVVEQVTDPTRHHGDFDPPWIGPATPVEEDLKRAVGHR